MSSRKILVITHAGGSPIHGPNMRWYFLAQALKEHGIQVELVSASFFHKYHTAPECVGEYSRSEVNGVEYHWILCRRYDDGILKRLLNQLDFVRGCYKSLERFKNRGISLVVASSPHPFVSYPALSIAKALNVPFVFELRDLWPELLISTGLMNAWHPYSLLLKKAQAHGIKNASKVIVVKPGEKNFLADAYKASIDKISYVPNGFFSEQYDSKVPELLLEVRKRHKKIVGYLGTLSDWYKVNEFISLAANSRKDASWGFVVVGKGTLETMLRHRIESEGLENVYLIGPVARAAVPEVLSCFDVCYLGMIDMEINRFGISSNKLYEYMAAGKPILANYSIGYDPVQEANCGFTVPSGDLNELRCALDTLLQNDELAATMGRNAKNYFKKHHDFRHVAEKVIDSVLSDLI